MAAFAATRASSVMRFMAGRPVAVSPTPHTDTLHIYTIYYTSQPSMNAFSNCTYQLVLAPFIELYVYMYQVKP